MGRREQSQNKIEFIYSLIRYSVSFLYIFTMATAISLNQKQLLSQVDIPKFSDDLRGIILNYMHFQETIKTTKDGKCCWLRLGPYLENNHIHLQLDAYDETVTHSLSSFREDCEAKAIHEYNKLKNNLHDVIHLEWDRVFFRDTIASSLGTFYSRYVFCPSDQCTILFQIKQHSFILTDFQLRTYYNTESFPIFDNVENRIGTKYCWQSDCYMQIVDDFKRVAKRVAHCSQLARKYGSKWHLYDDTFKNYRHRIKIEETFTEKEHTYTTEVMG